MSILPCDLVKRGRSVKSRFANLRYSRIFSNSSSLIKGSDSDGSEGGPPLDVPAACERPEESGAGSADCRLCS